MRKILTISGYMLLGALLTVLAFGTYTFVKAQAPTPQPGYPYGGMMGGGYQGGMWGAENLGRRGGPGMMGAYAESGEYGPMHDYMEEAWAKALNLTEEELEKRLSDGETMLQIARSQGFSEEQLTELFNQAHSEAMQKAVEAGVLSQEQADWMLNRMGGKFGGQFGGGCGGRARWNTPTN